VTPAVPPYRRGGGFGSLGVRFQEVFEPHAVSLEPQTLGAWLTLAVLALALLTGVAWLVQRALKRRHRRAAVKELDSLEAAWSANRARREPLEAVPVVLKRCALHAFQRQKVAPLAGQAWAAFLSETGPQPFGPAATRALVTITTRGASEVLESDVAPLFVAARGWIRRHRAEL
jgi:uncharacterized protein DUF4381